MPEKILLCIAGSGTTGQPRTAMLSRRALAWSVNAINERLGLHASDVWLNCLPLNHIGGASIVLRCVAARATMVLHERFDPASIHRDLVVRRVTHISLVPAMLERILDVSNSRPPPGSLRVVLVGGGPLSRPLAERAVAAGWPLYVSWGMTETASAVTIAKVDESNWIPGYVGRPLAGSRLEIIAPTGGETTGVGRIAIKGPCIMSGYAAPHTECRPRPVPRRFVSGDLGYLDSRGALHIAGRSDDTLVTGGENVHPARIESRLAECPGVRDIAVSAVDDPVWGERLVAVFTGTVSVGSLEDWSRQRLSGAQRPRGYIKVRRLPRNALGKLDRGRIRRNLPGWVSAANFPS
ncbi:MAG: AMP-binding protein [Pseudomonadota bacterium]|nr:AMP-binding protein [Pseudomonadota bacterium]